MGLVTAAKTASTLASAVGSTAAGATQASAAMPILPPPVSASRVAELMVEHAITKAGSPDQLLTKSIKHGLEHGMNNPSDIHRPSDIPDSKIHQSGEIYNKKFF